jgi:hypothetical protein
MTQLTRDEMPPYGFMFEDFANAGLTTTPPADWPSNQAAEWPAWFEKAVGMVKDHVWPEYLATGVWDGHAAENAIELTRVELALTREFRASFLDAAIFGPVPAGERHRVLFRKEDIGDWDKTLMIYCPVLNGKNAAMTDVVDKALERKSGEVDLQFKARFQRPRPYQMALLRGERDFPYELALHAITPALVSGHTLHAVIAGCAVYGALQRDDPGLARDCRESIQQWMMDIGDRRVMAGVHYPADGIASWIVTLEYIERVETTPGIRRFLAQAIREKSLLYRFLAAKIRDKASGHEAYRDAWPFLQGLL